MVWTLIGFIISSVICLGPLILGKFMFSLFLAGIGFLRACMEILGNLTKGYLLIFLIFSPVGKC